MVSPVRLAHAILVSILGVFPMLHAQNVPPGAPPNRIQLALNTDEAEAVLAILDKRNAEATIAGADWQLLFATSLTCV